MKQSESETFSPNRHGPAKQFPNVLHQSGGKLFCRSCNKIWMTKDILLLAMPSQQEQTSVHMDLSVESNASR